LKVDQIPDDNIKSNKKHKLTTSFNSPSPSSSNLIKCNNFCEKKSQVNIKLNFGSKRNNDEKYSNIRPVNYNQ